MKLGILSESYKNGAAIKVLVEGVLEGPIEVVDPGPGDLGWPKLLSTVKPYLTDLSYNTDGDGLVIVFDTDDMPVHEASHQGSTPIQGFTRPRPRRWTVLKGSLLPYRNASCRRSRIP